MKEIRIKPGIHEGKKIVILEFKYDKELIDLTKRIRYARLWSAKKTAVYKPTVRVVIGAGFNERHYQPTLKPAHLLKINKLCGI